MQLNYCMYAVQYNVLVDMLIKDDQYSTESSGAGGGGGGRSRFTHHSPRTQQSHSSGASRLYRTVSDESMCGALPAGSQQRQRTLATDSSDVIFTTAVPAQVVAMHSPKQYQQRSVIPRFYADERGCT